MKLLLIIIFISIPIAKSLIEIEDCSGLKNQESFWEKITHGYNKKQPPDEDMIRVFIRVEIAVVETIDITSASLKLKALTW